MKDDNRVSEQTFRVGINVNDPSIDVAAATLQTVDTGPGEWDYRMGQVGQDFLLADIFPLQQFLIVGFVMIGDNVPEGLEGFQLDASVETVGEFPQFALPLQSSTTAFRSTTVTIVDNDRRQQLHEYKTSFLNFHCISFSCSGNSRMGAAQLHF